jgi:hypothetical protein
MSADVATVTVNARVGSIGDVAVVRTVVGGLGRVMVGAGRLVTVIGESILDLMDNVRHDDG